MRVGALCAGYGGLELGLSSLIETDLKWFSEIEKHPINVMQTHFNAPNLGDLTQIIKPPEVDIVTAGFPCQPVSTAGQKKGVDDERWLIEDVCRVARSANAKWLILENVSAILTTGDGYPMARVCAELARHGFGRWEWQLIRASDVGAPHRRERWFCVATHTSSERGSDRLSRSFRQALHERSDTVSPSGSTSIIRNEVSSDTAGFGCETSWSRYGLEEKEESHIFGQFGPYEPAIRRWADIIRRLPPRGTINTGVNPPFVEWMMGLPEGWVSDIVSSTSAQLKMYGNGVVPQQAAYAMKTLIERLDNAY
jgi:DNA (cytosine-5)-methyltransferase 1|tara:strand:- start:9378 stop:10307 length:930 start_codon:yes stop_codon:yes gene_type:complete